MIQAIDEQPEFAIRAVLMYGQLSEEVVATAATEADAWRRLAEIAIAWRSGNDKHIPLWWGGGVA